MRISIKGRDACGHSRHTCAPAIARDDGRVFRVEQVSPNELGTDGMLCKSSDSAKLLACQESSVLLTGKHVTEKQTNVVMNCDGAMAVRWARGRPNN